jgi:Ca2+:H+ antiporter
MTRDRVSTLFSVVMPIIGVLVVASTWGSSPSWWLTAVLVALHIILVLVSVAHAEVIARRVGEPYGTLVLALAVTVIEVSLIITLMTSGSAPAETLARDSIFAVIMIVCNGVVGIALILDARKDQVVLFNEQGANALLGTVMAIAVLALVMPSFTSSSQGPTFTGAQLAFSAISAAVMYSLFVYVQSGRHRWMFLSPEALAAESGDSTAHVEPHEPRKGQLEGLDVRIVLLLVSLAGVVGLAKTLAPRIEDVADWAGAPRSFVGVVIALLVLFPESIAAFRAASQGEMQTSLNLSLGSALASIGLTIPAIAIASIWIDAPITLGLGPKEIVFLAITAVLSILTFGSGRATVIQAAQHLLVFSAFLFLSYQP